MTLKEKTKTYSFWISLVSCLLIIAKTVVEQFDISISQNIVNTIVTAICAVLVLFGIVSSPTKAKEQTLDEIQKQTQQTIKEQQNNIDSIKEEIKSNMKDIENMTIQEQIEYLRAKLAEADTEQAQADSEQNKTQAEQETAEVQEQTPEVAETTVATEIQEITEENAQDQAEPEFQEENHYLCLSEQDVQEIKEMLFELLNKF